jgi:hypothetical protein
MERDGRERRNGDVGERKIKRQREGVITNYKLQIV